MDRDDELFPRIPRFNAPTMDDLRALHPDSAVVQMIRAVLCGFIKPEKASKRCAEWVRGCYSRPCWQERALWACDDLLGNCGVESINPEGADYHYDGTGMCPPFSYSNNGDTYATTLIRDHAAGAWVVSSWGDVYEEYERDHEEMRDDG